jgi:transposase InsO family protein
MQVFEAAVSLIVKSVVLSAQWAGQRRRLCLRQAVARVGELAQLRAELMTLRDENHRLKSENGLLRSRLREAPSCKRYSLMERLQILWHMAYYAIPRSRVKEHFGIAKSTFYRWLHAAEQGHMGDKQGKQESPRKTPAEIARLIRDIFEANPHFGRHRIAMTLWTLRVFVAASTVRNVLLRPAPPKAPATAAVKVAHAKPRQIVARYPNHVWSVDRTRVWRWHIWPTWVLVGIDHYSRMVTTTCPLEGPNAAWVTTALESAFARYGAPKHIITDQEAVFTSGAFAELVDRWQVTQRFAAVGQHGSIAVTERVIRTLKYEWLHRLPIIRGADHLSRLLDDFALYYNHYRGHMACGGALPAALYQGEEWHKPPHSAKAVLGNIERHVFRDVRVTAYRLAA